MDSSVKRRLKRLCGAAAAILAAGFGYAWLCLRLGGTLIPCLIHELTSLYCPGCGLSRMCLALLRLDLAAAFRANMAVFLLLVPGAVLTVQLCIQYVKIGHVRPSRRQAVVIGLVIVCLLLFGILRNLPAFSFLQPTVS